MPKYIDKDAAVAEIKKRLKEAESHCGGYKSYDEHRCDNCTVEFYEEFLELLEILEVKEVDLEEEIERCLKRHHMLAVGKKDFTEIAKHFFELGLQRGMTDKEQIIAEIERLYKEWELGTSAEAKYRREAYKELLDTIDSMGAEDKPKFNVGDVVMRLDGDGRPHRIVSIEKINSMNGDFFYRYHYEDGGCDSMDCLLGYYTE